MADKTRGQFAKGFLGKSPFLGADANLIAATSNMAKTGHMGKLIEAMGKSERSSQIVQNVKKVAALAAGVPPSALPESGGEAEGLAKLFSSQGEATV